MQNGWLYERGDVLRDVQTGRQFRVERRLRDDDTDVRLYALRNEDVDRELMRNAKLIENKSCFAKALPKPL